MRRRTVLLSLLGLPVLGSRLLRAEPRVERDVVYGEAGGEKLLLDVYRPEGTGPFPAVILIHGGGWSGGDKRTHGYPGNLLARNGYVAFSVNYRLTPKHPWPAALDDCQRAVRWIRRHAKEYDADATRMGALGESAGGHLVSLLGVRDTRDNGDPELSRFSSRVQAVVNYFGPTDLAKAWDVEVVRRLLTAFLGGPPEARPLLYADASPLVKVGKDSAPHLILHGTKDPLVKDEQSRWLDEALKKNGVESTLLIFEGAGHGWAPTSEPGRKSEAAILGFFEKHLKTAR